MERTNESKSARIEPRVGRAALSRELRPFSLSKTILLKEFWLDRN
jgi:hypothetical protein